MMRTWTAGLTALGLSLALAGPSWAYKAVALKGGGTIAGVVKLEGTPPPAKTIKATKDEKVCGKQPIPNEELVVGKEGGIRWAVVSLTDIKSGKKWDLPKPVIDQKGCIYKPHVLVVKPKARVVALNSDGILHNLHSYPDESQKKGGVRGFNIAQPKFRKKVKLSSRYFKMPGIINLKCDAHPWMSGYIVVAEHPYFAVTDEKGQFTLSNVPPGTYTLEVWQESLGKTSQKVTVKASEKTSVSVTLKKK
ncbi:MAG: carboxypeptidase regulatory-like domain-containing protein [Nitrospinota bacterium]